MSSPSNSPHSPSPLRDTLEAMSQSRLLGRARLSPLPAAAPPAVAQRSLSPTLDDTPDADADADVDADADADAALNETRADSPDLPLTMTASTVLLNLPRDATAALAAAGQFPRDKVVVRFKPVGSAPALAAGGGDTRRKIAATQKFEAVVAFVRRALKVRESESVFLYINSAFAPALDEVVGNLHQCFKDSHDQLNVTYSLTPAFG